MISRAGLWFWLALTLILIPSITVQARLIRRTKSLASRDSASSSVLSSASWIWSPDSDETPKANVAFLKTFATPPGKTGTHAVVSMTAADRFTLWVNGQPIGASGNETDAWKSAHVFRAALDATTNVFSVLIVPNVNSGAPASGLLAAIQIIYTDNTTDSVVSDSSWGVTADIPVDFPSPLNTSAFATAAVLAPYGSGLWGNSTILAPADPAPLSLAASAWIWSEANSSTVDVPVGNTGFRKTVSSPSGKTAVSAQVLLTVDNSFDLFLNGRTVGSPPYDPNDLSAASVWNYAQQFTVDLDPGVNVFIVIAKNFRLEQGGPNTSFKAGFIAAIRMFYADNSSDLIGTDATWLTGNITDISTFLSTNDIALRPSIAQGPFGMAPWGQLSGISDALDAARVPPGPYTFATSGTQSPGGPSNTPGSDSESEGVHPLSPWIIVGSVVVVLGAIGLLSLFWLDVRRKRLAAPPLPVPLPLPALVKRER